MRRSTIVVTATALAVIGLGTWIALRSKTMPALRPAAQLASESRALEPPAPAPAKPTLVLPPEPEPPAPGTPARQVYFKAMVAGEERGLATARKALAEAKAGGGRTDPTYLRTLQALEKTYGERLSHHQRELASSP